MNSMKPLALITILAGLAGPAVAQDAEAGRETYERYCATCHGIDAMGNGPMQAVLTVLPKDLTALTRENGGVFPLERVVKRIDGRDPLVAHGSPMPVYGDFFDDGQGVSMKTDAGQPIMTSQGVVDLIAYIRGLQAD